MSAAPPAFVHDLATCVGCHACVVACASENATAPGGSWRQVLTFNEDHHPALPVFHLSLACNHCLDAPCERHCPALAIRRDARTGAVLIDAERCIGCRYCTWVCPVRRAPLRRGAGVMGKCTLCHDRLLEGGTPACTTACPTGALKLGTLDGDGPHGVPGFPDVGLPARDPVPAAAGARARCGRGGGRRRGGRGRAPSRGPLRSARCRCGPSGRSSRSRRSSSCLVAWLGALQARRAVRPAAAVPPGRRRGPRPERAAPRPEGPRLARRPQLAPLVAQPRGPRRARLFLALAAAFLLLAPAQKSAGALAAAAGLVALGCMDRVYVVMARERRSRGDDTAAFAERGVPGRGPGDAALARPSRRPWRVSPRSRSG